MSDSYYEEEEFQSKFNGKTLERILGLTQPHLKWVIGFLITIALVAGLDAVSTYISKHIIDEGIVAKNTTFLINSVILYGSLILIQAGSVFLFIYLAGILGERIRYDLRKNDVQSLARSFLKLFQQNAGRLDHGACHL